MSWLTNLKLKSKLLSAFCLCALITVAVGVLGHMGISRLYDLFQSTVTNNLLSITKVDSVKANVIATNRDFFKAIGLSAIKASPDEVNAAIQSLKENQAQAESDFKVYRGTPLQADEKAAGDDFERDWQAYVAAVANTLAVIQSGDIEQASKLAASSVTPTYRKTMAELKIIIESNARQANEATQAGVDTDRQVTWVLIIGSLLAVICAIALGLIVTRMITRPIYQSVESAARVASGDLTQAIAVGGQDETGQLLKALSNMQGSLKGTVQQIGVSRRRTDRRHRRQHPWAAAPERRDSAGCDGSQSDDRRCRRSRPQRRQCFPSLDPDRRRCAQGPASGAASGHRDEHHDRGDQRFDPTRRGPRRSDS